jgi:hypothetical protein
VAPFVVNIELYGIVRDIVHDTGVELRLDDSEAVTFKNVLEGLVQTYGPALQGRLFDRYGPSSFVKVFAGGRLVTDLNQPLPDTEGNVIRIIVLAAAGGG